MSVTVRVPATSANLGPGFDALAVAVGVHLSVRVTERSERRVVTEGEGAGEVADDETNLVWRALAAWHEHVGAALPDVSLHATNDIPLERGLGSSAAAAVAGLAVGRVLTGSGGDVELVALAAALEGHRDNGAAALLGGLVLCEGDRVRRLDPTPRLRPVLCVPGQRQSTAAARRLLPETVSLADAAANGARTAAVLAGLSGAVSWEPESMTDVLHEPARFRAMPDSGRLVEALRSAGVGAALSGAGPSVFVVCETSDDEALELVRAQADGWEVLPSRWDLAGASLTAAEPHLG